MQATCRHYNCWRSKEMQHAVSGASKNSAIGAIDDAGGVSFALHLPLKEAPAMTDAASSRTRNSTRRKRESTKPASRGKTLPGNKLAEARRVAIELYRKQPDWFAFHTALYGVGGEIVKLFPTPAEQEAFKASEAFAEIEALTEDLRRQAVRRKAEAEPTRIITVRIPRSVHEALRDEANRRKTSINKLCIAKLVQKLKEGLE
jgi:hypothetical protein